MNKDEIAVIDKIALPGELLNLIKNYAFPNKIPKTDPRYTILTDIPPKEYDITDGVTFVYMKINETKDYYMTYKNYEIDLQTLLYDGYGIIECIEAHRVLLL